MSILFIIVPFLLIILQGVFAASETGILSIENMTLVRAQDENKKWAFRVGKFLARPEQFFSTILICENFIIVIASSLFANFFIKYFGESSTIISTVILSFFSLTFGLFIPKLMALSDPVKTMKVLSIFVYYLEIFLYPLVSFFATIAKCLSKIFPGKNEKAEIIHRLDIIYAMGEYEEKASKFAARFFDFSKRIIADVMIPLEATFLCSQGKELDALSSKNKRVFTRIPIYEKRRDNIVGIFNIKDYFYTNKVILRKPLFVDQNERCMSIFFTMKQQGEHLAVVRKNNKQVVGIITLEDLLEELVGEIRDEQ